MLHHDGQEPHDDFGAGPQENLPLPSLLGVVDAFQSIGKAVHTNHVVSENVDQIRKDFLRIIYPLAY